MPLTVLEIFKVLPRTNCGDCGVPTCLAFATRVIKEGEELGRCPYLSPAAQELDETVRLQQQAGVGRRRESVAISLEVMHDKVAPLDLATLAPGLAATFGEENGRPYLAFPYFGRPVKVFKDKVAYPPGTPEDPWDAILLYNYIASQGKEPETGPWITFKELPNSVSKSKTLARLEEKVAQAYAGRGSALMSAALALGAAPEPEGEAEVSLSFRPLPRVPLRLMFWEAQPDEGFPALVRFLFDANVPAYLDLESLLFLVEKLVERLVEAADN
jgi:hypothetical protein